MKKCDCVSQPFKALFHEVFLQPGPIALGGGGQGGGLENGEPAPPPPKISTNFMKEKGPKASKFGHDRHGTVLLSTHYALHAVVSQ